MTLTLTKNGLRSGKRAPFFFANEYWQAWHTLRNTSTTRLVQNLLSLFILSILIDCLFPFFFVSINYIFYASYLFIYLLLF